MGGLIGRNLGELNSEWGGGGGVEKHPVGISVRSTHEYPVTISSEKAKCIYRGIISKTT